VGIEDIRDFISELEKHGELKRVKTEVDSDLEIAEIMRREMYSNGPAILFENVKGYDMPVLGIRKCIWFYEKIGDRIRNDRLYRNWSTYCRYDKDGHTIRITK
jgi:hypothetical protein